LGQNNGDNRVSEQLKAGIFAGLGLLLIAMGLCFTPDPAAIAAGLQKMIYALNLLDPNMFLAVDGALGAVYVNAGILVLCVVASYMLTKCKIGGGQIAALFMVMGFSFCGKTIVNVWPIVAGTLLYAVVHKKPIASMIHTAWFATALTPIFNTVAFYSMFNGENHRANDPTFQVWTLLLAIVLCVLAGFGVGFMSSILPEKHGGYTLYNVGFAAGVIGLLMFSAMKAMGLGHEGTADSPLHKYTEDIANIPFSMSLVVILLYLGVCGLILGRDQMHEHRNLLARCEKGGDHVELHGFAAALVNMSVMGLIFMAYTYLVQGNFNGALFAALFTAVGFSANGITIKSVLPIMAGVFFASFMVGGVQGALTGKDFLAAGYAYAGTKNMLIAALYGCGMAPVTGKHGPLAGFIMGAIHSVLVPNTGSLHGWLCLYNNGFCMGLVTTFYTSFVEKLENPWKRTNALSGQEK